MQIHIMRNVHLTRAGEQESCLAALGEAQHVHRADEPRLHRLDRVVLVMDRAGRARQVVDLSSSC